MKPTKVRWGVITLLFFSAIVIFLDRTNLSVALPVLAKTYGWGPAAMGALSSAFMLCYTLLQFPAGPLTDRFGARLSIIWISVACSLVTVVTAICNSFASFYIIRVLLGLAEAPGTPAAMKMAAEWTPRTERGAAMGLLVAGSTFGSALCLPLVALLVTTVGWRLSFVITGLLGFVWLAFFLALYRERKSNPRVNKAEHELIERGLEKKEEQPSVPWTHLFGRRSTWGLVLGYFCQAYILFVFLSWLPTYLVQARHMTLLRAGFSGMVPFLSATLGCYVGGALADRWVKKASAGRKYTMALGLIIAIAIVPAVFVNSTGLAVFLLSVSAFGVMFSNGASWSACSEIAPVGQTASLVSLQNFGGSVGAFLAPLVTGLLIQGSSGSYVSALVLSGTLAIVGAVLYMTLVPSSRTTQLVKAMAH